ncbi:MAG TPA: sugar phosphate nucleotidyltransferase, partial [Acidimicrobiia bacterium]|nr:sugar phosphate nucleotidyltransferase [Acidimicrobiia bacterium]
MRAVVLVGGEGTRLRPLTFETPKPLLPVANEVFLDRQLGWLAAHGVDEVGLSLGYLPHAFVERYPEGTFTDADGREVRLHYAPEPTPLGTAGAV